MAELAELIGKAGSYAGLRFAVDTTDAELGALMQRVEERATAINTRVLFFELEWAALSDERVDELLADERLEFARHYLRSARRYRPHLLTEPEEKILAEKDVTGSSAWSRLFDELTSTITIDLDGETGRAGAGAVAPRVAGPGACARPRPRRSPTGSSPACAPARSSSTRCSRTRPPTTGSARTRHWIASAEPGQRGERRVGAGAGRRGAGPQRHPAALVLAQGRSCSGSTGSPTTTAWRRSRRSTPSSAGTRPARWCSTRTRSFSPDLASVAQRFFDEQLDRRAGPPGEAAGRVLRVHGPVAAPVPAPELDRRAVVTCSRSPTSSGTACTPTWRATRASSTRARR